MGGGPDDREHMLIVLWNPEPKDLVAKIKEEFPYIDVTWFQLKSARANQLPESDQGVPKGSYQSSLYMSPLLSLSTSAVFEAAITSCLLILFCGQSRWYGLHSRI